MSRSNALATSFLGVALAGCSEPEPPRAPAGYVGRATCVSCHSDQHAAWTGSHHDLAMQEVDPDTVLGDFDDQVVFIVVDGRVGD